jgi:hypothetical protein
LPRKSRHETDEALVHDEETHGVDKRALVGVRFSVPKEQPKTVKPLPPVVGQLNGVPYVMQGASNVKEAIIVPSSPEIVATSVMPIPEPVVVSASSRVSVIHTPLTF